MTGDIEQWLEALDLIKYRDAFSANEIVFGDLSELTEDDLKVCLRSTSRRKIGRMLWNRRGAWKKSPVNTWGTSWPSSVARWLKKRWMQEIVRRSDVTCARRDAINPNASVRD